MQHGWAPDESWSPGRQPRQICARVGIDGQWCECMGSSPTTHIFKNGVIGFKLEALNEFVCMKSAQRAGIATANVEYRMFEDEPALIVERYDRVKVKDGTIIASTSRRPLSGPWSDARSKVHSRRRPDRTRHSGTPRQYESIINLTCICLRRFFSLTPSSAHRTRMRRTIPCFLETATQL